MIVTVTPNPSIDRTVTLPARLVRGAVHRVQSVSTEPGAEGDDAARAPPLAALDTRALLTPREAAAWFTRELDRLQLAISGARGVPTLADGGLPVGDLSRAIPDEDRDRVLGEMLLES